MKKAYLFLLTIFFILVLAPIRAAVPEINLSEITSSPYGFFTTSTLLGWCNATDDTDEEISYRWKWFLNGILNESGYESSWCYQESANVSTECGGLATGGYSFEGTWNDPDHLVDGDWNTESRTATDGNASFNYTKPTGATNESRWQVSDSSGVVNLSLGSCIDNDPVQLRVIQVFIVDNYELTWECNTTTGWDILREISSGNDNSPTEEAMIWDIPIYREQSLKVNVANISSDLLEAEQNWTLECTAYNSTYNSTPVNSTTIKINEKTRITGHFISPSTPNTSSNLNCNATIIDNYNTTLGVEYFWYNLTTNGYEFVIGGNTTVSNNTNSIITILGSGNTTKGETWNCTIRAYNGSFYTDYNSTTVSIEKSVPILSLAEITSYPINFRNNSVLLGWCSATEDDNEDLSYSATWYKNNVLYEEVIPEYISAGGIYHTCSILTNGSAYCWGYNNFGQLGIGDIAGTTNISNPAAVNISSLFKSISAGNTHTCGILTNGSAYCWGYNNFGQLGIGDIAGTTNISNPAAVNISSLFKSISAGNTHTCGILTNGSGYCWGDNDFGQLGIGDITGITNKSNPAAINTSSLFKSISAGWDYTCGILTNGSAYCWGYNNFGQLGDGGTDSKNNTAAINTSSLFKSINAGYSHTCGILTNGSAYCWGYGFYGQLGDGGTDSKNNPVAVNTSSLFKSISVGLYHTCGILMNGSGYCWGQGQYGQLGDGGTESKNNTAAINTSSLFKSISAGQYHTCGILMNGSAYCWGYGFYGQLGDGQTGQTKIINNNTIAVNTTSRMWPFYTPGLSVNIANITYGVSFGQNWTLQCIADNGLNSTSAMNSTIIVIALPVLAVNITYPLNNTKVNSSFDIDLSISTNESATCRYAIDSGSLIQLNSGSLRTNFSTTFNIYSNTDHNITVNCTDTISTVVSKINITINDHTAPNIDIESEDRTSSSITISFSTDEPANWTIRMKGEAPQNSSSRYDNSTSVTFTDLESETKYYYNITACDQLGNCAIESDDRTTLSETVPNDDDDNNGERRGSSTSAPSTTGSTSVKTSQIWNNPQAGQYTMSIPTAQIAITQIIFILKNDILGSILFSVEKITDIPNFISGLDDKVYQYVKIDKSLIKDSNLSNVNIKFRIDKVWINSNRINPDTVHLYRYTEQWDELLTTKLSTDATYIYYEADSPGLSYFGIKGEVLPPQQQPTPPTQDNKSQQEQQPPTGNDIDEPIDNPVEEPKKNNFVWLIFLGIFLIIITGAGGFLVYQRNVSVLSDEELKEIRDYVEKCKSEGIEYLSIKAALLKVGWSESVIDLVMHDVHLPAKDMNNLLAYITYMKKNNKTEDEIKNNLKRVGWQEEIINEAIFAVNDQNKKK